jgi:pyruvate,water dikinase
MVTDRWITDSVRWERLPYIARELKPLTQWPHRSRTGPSPAAAGDVLCGIGGSAGSYTGRVCVVNDLNQAEALEPGEVLVAPLTDAAWTPLFLVAGAVVVNMGSLNSHAVVMSRELGIPCVLSVTDATRRLADGSQVTVNGSDGTVSVDAVPAPV